MTKENRFLFAHDDETRADMEELSTILHVSMSEVLRQGVETLKVKIVGTISGDNSKVTIVEGDGTLIRVDQTPEELAARE